jgi:hypothetical protein
LAWGETYTVNFEGDEETKTAYASGTVKLSGLDWDLTEALIGTDASDYKEGVRSARLRGYGTSAITMLANKANGIATLSFKYRRYGTDAQEDWKVEYSTDNGSTWTQIGSGFTAPASDDVQTFSETINQTGNIRIRIKRATESGTSNKRLNIDNIEMTDYTGSGPDNPSSFTATTSSPSQIDLSWVLNGSSNDVMIAWNSENVFGEPSGSYSAGNSISGGGTVLYNGSGTSHNHTSLTEGTTYYYKAWSVDGSNAYSTGVTANATTLKNEPTNHVTDFMADTGTPSYSAIDIIWTDASPAADAYLVKGSNVSYAAITNPVDGTAEADGGLVLNVASGDETASFSGLNGSSTYYFKIFPYNNSGSNINYKTDGTVPTANATTDEAPAIPKLIISEVADPSNVANAKFVEIYNNNGSTIDFDTQTWYLARQANGSSTSWADVQLTGTLSNGAVYTIAYNQSDFESSFSKTANLYSGIVSGNGDDGYFLYYGGDHTSGTLIDAYGVIDEDGTGKAWEYEDSRAVRDGVTQGNTSWTASEWTISSATTAQCTPGTLDNDQSLPVTLSSFTAKATKAGVVLEWSTSAEIENAGFVIYRSEEDSPRPPLRGGVGSEADHSTNSPSERGLGGVLASYLTDNALVGQGSVTKSTHYTFTDSKVEAGKSYVYTLSDVDFSGKETILEKLKVELEVKGIVLADHYTLYPVYPNPFNASFTVPFSLNEKMAVKIALYNIAGQQVMNILQNELSAGEYQYQVNADALPSGVYFVKTNFSGTSSVSQRISDRKSHTQKIVLMK